MNFKKTISILILVAFVVSTITTIPIQPVNAQSSMKTYPFVVASPNLIGIGQETVIRLGITVPLAADEYGWEGLTLVVTDPNGKNETFGPFRTDSTGGTYAVYTPSIVGNYSLQAFFPEQKNPARLSSSGLVIPEGTIMLASSSEAVPLFAQADPIPSAKIMPLPTEYWVRPINNQYQSWQSIGGNWLAASNSAGTSNRIAYGNDYAPQSPHVLWSRPITVGGLVGGSEGYTTGAITDDRVTIGDAYQGKFIRSVIMLGILYYDGYSSTSKLHEYTAVDLHTGKTLWTKTLLNNLTLTRGQLMQWNSINVVGTYPYLWATGNSDTLKLLGLPSNAGTTWCAFDPYTGEFIYAIYGIPSGSTVFGENGEILIYTVNTARGYMTLWNSTNIPSLYAGTEVGSSNIQQWIPEGKIVNGTGLAGTTYQGQPASYYLTPTGLAGYMWNASIPTGLTGSVISVLDDRIIGGNSSSAGVTLWAVSIDPCNPGHLLFKKTWDAPKDWSEGSVTVAWQATSDKSKDGIIVFSTKETRQNFAFSTETGNYLWTTSSHEYLDFYTMGLGGGSARSVAQIYDGKFYSAGYAGTLYCYDTSTGSLLWKYVANNLEAFGSSFSQWPLYPMFIANGMIYVIHTEHSGYEQSLPPGAPMLCLNATDGDVIWRADGLIRGTHWGGYPIIGDSIITALNTYDLKIYAIGRGPSAVTIEAPMTGVTVGSNIVLRGSVLDISPGAEQDETKLRFPNGVPAVSDDNMTEWMRYVYQQTNKPLNVKGVEISLYVIDANENYRSIGTTVTDETGFFSYVWNPDISGKYTVYAKFEGSNSYYPSQATTAFVADETEATPSPTETPPSVADQYFIPAIAGIFVLIIIVLVLLVIMMFKKKE